MVIKAISSWAGLVSVIIISLLGIRIYISFFMFFVPFLIGVLTILYLKYDVTKCFSFNLDCSEDPLQSVDPNVQLTKVQNLLQSDSESPKFDSRITGSDVVDSFLNEIIAIIINDYVVPWYSVLTDDLEFTNHTIKKIVISTGANLANRIKCVDWIHLLSTKFPEELTTHLKIFKQARVKLKQKDLLNLKEVPLSKQFPKNQNDEKTHRRNKSDTDITWPTDTSDNGKLKFFGSAENLSSRSLKDIFFDLECCVENKKICRDLFCMDSDMQYKFFCELSEAILYLLIPEETWKCHALKLILVELLTAIVLKPLIDMISEPDNINKAVIKHCSRDSCLSSELFLTIIRCCGNAEELDATLEIVQKDIQKLHSKDTAGEWELHDRQKLSSLKYLKRVIEAKRASLTQQEGASNNTNSEKVTEEVSRSLKFLRATAAWRSNAQYLLETEVNDLEPTHTPKTVLSSLRSSALDICDTFLAPNRPPILGVTSNCHAELVRKVTAEDGEFSANPLACFDDVQKSVCDALEEDTSWQLDFMMDADQENLEKNCRESTECHPEKKNLTGHQASTSNTRHNRSRSDVVGNQAIKMFGGTGVSNLTTMNAANLSLSHSVIGPSHSPRVDPLLSANIIETALVQDRGKSFGIYAVAVTRLTDDEMWHIYRRYSDFYDLHTNIKEKWPELSTLVFPAKKTFQNTSRSVLESRKRMLNVYLQSLTHLSRDPRYVALRSQHFLGGFLSPEAQAEKQQNSLDGLIVNSFKAGMRTLKSMPDQFAHTVDGVMDGISKVFQPKNIESCDPIKSDISPEEGDESVALRLLEEVLSIRGLWLRRTLLAPLRTLIADRVNRKVLQLVSSLTSPKYVLQYLKKFREWLTSERSEEPTRPSAVRARTRVAAKVFLLAAYTDELKHVAGAEPARRGLLTVFDLFQVREINTRLALVLLEAVLVDLFPDNNIKELFSTLYSNSPRVPEQKRPCHT